MKCPGCKRQMIATITDGVGCPTLGRPNCVRNTTDWQFRDEVRNHVAGVTQLMEFANAQTTGYWASDKTYGPSVPGVYGAAQKLLTAIIAEELGPDMAFDCREEWNFGGHKTWLDSVEAAVREVWAEQVQRESNEHG